MATGNVTKRSVDALTATGKNAFLWDADIKGFGVKITPTGSKSYIYEYRIGGRAGRVRRVTIGKHGSVTPDQARTKARQLSAEIVQGADPVADKAKAKREQVTLAFNTYVEFFTERYLKSEWAGSWKDGHGMLVREAVPILKDKPLPSITRSDLSQIWDRTGDRPAIERLTFATLRKMFRWAVSRGDIDRSPMEGITPPSPLPNRDRVLTDIELTRVWNAASKMGYPFGTHYHLLILTGQRREEVAALDWSELDRASATWTLPAKRAKNGVTSIVPLNASAVAELDAVAALRGSSAWPSKGLVLTTNGRTPISGYSKAKARLDGLVSAQEADAISHWRVHDIRRTLATGLQRLGVRFEVTEAVQNHVSGAKSGVAGIYQRHDWKEEKRAALDAWGRHVEGLLNPADQSNVLPFKELHS